MVEDNVAEVDFDQYEERQDDDFYRVDSKGFSKVLKDHINLYNAISLINTAFSKGGKGCYLMFPSPEDPNVLIPFNKKHLRSANAKFAKSLMMLKNYHRVSMKKKRKPVPPESFSGTYTPVYAGNALVKFFRDGGNKFGYVHPSDKSGGYLMDKLEMVKTGYLLRNTSTMLFYIYAHSNNLQDPDNAQLASSDRVMNDAFGGNHPATFYSSVDDEGNTTKITMEQAVDEKYIKKPLNTYDTIKLSKPEFDPKNFKTYFYQNIAALNYYPKESLLREAQSDENFEKVYNSLYSDEVKERMLREHNLVKSVSDEWHSILEPDRKDKRDARKLNKKTK